MKHSSTTIADDILFKLCDDCYASCLTKQGSSSAGFQVPSTIQSSLRQMTSSRSLLGFLKSGIAQLSHLISLGPTSQVLECPAADLQQYAALSAEVHANAS